MHAIRNVNEIGSEVRQSFWRNEMAQNAHQDEISPFSAVHLGNYIVYLPREPRCNNPELPLSQREKQVLFLSACGYVGPQIAEKMGIAPNTVSTFKRRIMEKLGCRSMCQASVIATAYALGATVREAHN